MSGAVARPQATTSNTREWSVKDIRALGEKKMGKRACWWQIKAARALYEGNDVVCVAPTGMGKTLSFLLALLMALAHGKDCMITVVTPLNLLGKQNADILNQAGLPALAISSENATPANYQEIGQGKYRVVTIGPELVKEEPFQKLLEDPKFQSRLLYVVVDEAHCVSQWGRSFRDEYLNVGNIRDFLPDRIPFYALSATLPPPILRDVVSLLLRSAKTVHIILSNDRPNVHLSVREISHSIASHRDLDFLIPANFRDDDDPPPKFLIFCDSTRDTEDISRHLHQRLPRHLRAKIKWFHATMTSAFRDEEFVALRSGQLWGLVVTDAFGMGMDLPDIALVIQWRIPKDMCTLWQRFGRGGRDLVLTSTAILFTDKADMDVYREKKAEAARKTAETRKRKAQDHAGDVPSKCRVLNDRNTAPAVTLVPPVNAEPRSISERRVLYHQESKISKATGNKRQLLVVGSAMDDMINAGARGINCRREPASVYFGNVVIANDYHLRCDPWSELGCQRCRPKKSDTCCDLCNPDAFEWFTTRVGVEDESTTQPPGKSRLGKYDIGEKDRDLKAALYRWRDTAARAELSIAVLTDYGPEMLISNALIQRIVDCAHFRKLHDADALYRETRWSREYVDQYADMILACISAVWPPPLPCIPQSGEKQKRSSRCSTCGEVGHIKTNSRLCTKYYTDGPGKAKENTQPATSSGPSRPPIAIAATPRVPQPLNSTLPLRWVPSPSPFTVWPPSITSTPLTCTTSNSNSSPPIVFPFLNFMPQRPHSDN